MDKAAERAAQLDTILLELKNQLSSLKQKAPLYKNSSDVKSALQIENQQLKDEVLSLKKQLTDLETASGVTPVSTDKPAPGGPIKAAPKPAAVPKQEATPAVKQEPKSEPVKEAPKPKQQKKQAAPKNAPAAAGPMDVSRLDMRVGFIRTAKQHPDADGLYLEEIDCGEAEPRQVISGLVKHIPINEMQERPCILLCNLKPAKMRGIMSHAMVMCASTPDKVEILAPPADSKPGDIVTVAGYEGTPDPQLNPKKKVFEAVQPDFLVSKDGYAMYKGVEWLVGGQKITAATMRECGIK